MTRPDYRLVELGRDTVGVLERGAAALFDKPLHPDSLDAFIADPHHLLWFAVVEGQPVGFASASILLHPDKKSQLFINEVAVHESFRRNGIGRALVGRLVEAARTRGCNYAWLGTETDNASGNACFGSVPGARNAGPFILYEWEIDD